MKTSTLFTSESVSEGHPDKVADQISDAAVDFILGLDPHGMAAIETLIGPGYVVIAGEAFARVDQLEAQLSETLPTLTRKVLTDIGYGSPESCLDVGSLDIDVRVGVQSLEIRQKVDRDDGQIGAGDQGLMFGYASDETAALMPAALQFAHDLMARHAELRKSGRFESLLPDAKSQVTVRYEDGQFAGVEKVLVSTQHSATINLGDLRELVVSEVIDPVIPESMRSPGFELMVNPFGSFVLGGPAADCGLTGRKIIVDTYGGSCPHGGGAFSGKDPSKVDRSAAYACRYVAKNIVAAGLASRCTVQLAYAIGSLFPLSVAVDGHGTERVPATELVAAVSATFDLSPSGIMNALNLRRPIYQPTAKNGHFGRSNVDFSWEVTDRVGALRSIFGESLHGFTDEPALDKA